MTRSAEPTIRTAERRRRVFLIALSIFTIALTPINVWQKYVLRGHAPSAFVATAAATGKPFVSRVTKVPPGSELRVGDIVDLRSLSPEERYRAETHTWVVGQSIRIPVTRGDRSIVLTTRAEHADFFSRATPNWAIFWLTQIALVLIPLFALVLTVKRPASPELRNLALLLLFVSMTYPLDSSNWITPWVWLDVSAAVLGNAAGTLYWIFIALFGSMFARPLTPLRRVLCVATMAFAVADGALYDVLNVGSLGTTIDLSTLPPQVFLWAYFLPDAGAFAIIVLAALSAQGAERARVVWVMASLAPLFAQDAVSIVSAIFPIFGIPWIVNDLSLFFVVFGLSYALFNRRLLDVGFALNRATVFAALSLLVFGAFNLTEWALGGWLSTLNRTTNAALSATLALALGLSLKPLHDGVERIVDRTFFRKRNEAERALRAVAHEAAFYTDSTTLIGAATSAIAKHAETASAALILERDGNFDGLEPDDAALVALRAWQRRLDLHTVPSALSGEYAFPLIVRGKLTGVLAIGPKRSAEPYAPDELDAIDRIALAVGIALDGLDRAPERSNDRTIALFESVEATMNALADRMLTLAGAIDTLAGRMEPATGATGNGAVPASLSTTAPPS